MANESNLEIMKDLVLLDANPNTCCTFKFLRDKRSRTSYKLSAFRLVTCLLLDEQAPSSNNKLQAIKDEIAKLLREHGAVEHEWRNRELVHGEEQALAVQVKSRSTSTPPESCKQGSFRRLEGLVVWWRAAVSGNEVAAKIRHGSIGGAK
jgi:hypothetical protein